MSHDTITADNLPLMTSIVNIMIGLAVLLGALYLLFSDAGGLVAVVSPPCAQAFCASGAMALCVCFDSFLCMPSSSFPNISRMLVSKEAGGDD